MIKPRDGTPKLHTVFFIVNKDLTVYKTIVVPPIHREIRILDYAINPVDEQLYISLKYDNFDNHDSTSLITPKYCQILRMDDYFTLETYWTYPKQIYFLAECPIAFSETGSPYVFLETGLNGDEMLVKLDSLGSVEWEMKLDTPFVTIQDTSIWTDRPYNINDIVVGKNGDIIGVGKAVDVKYDIGESTYLFKASPTGQKKWDRVIRSNIKHGGQEYGFQTWLNRVLELPNGDIVAGGEARVFYPHYTPTTPWKQEAWVVRTDSNGCLAPNCGFIQDVVQKQNYIPIVDPKNEWTVDHFSNVPWQITIARYSFSTDSVLIGNHYWHELMYTESAQGYTGTNVFYREENGKVYSTFSSDELLIYDFSLNLGDTMKNVQPNTLAFSDMEVAEVGSTILLDGVPRKVIKMSQSSPIIEGVGQLGMLFSIEYENSLYESMHRRLRCFKQDGELVWLRADLSGCETSDTKNSTQENVLDIFPNPTSGLISIQLDKAAQLKGKLLIFDVLGKVVFLSNINSKQELQNLDMTALQSGLYFFTIQENNGMEYRGKFIRD